MTVRRITAKGLRVLLCSGKKGHQWSGITETTHCREELGKDPLPPSSYFPPGQGLVLPECNQELEVGIP